MCSACDDEPIQPYVPVNEDIVRRARTIEMAMAGDRVPETAWSIYFGFAGGSIEWRHFQRLRQAHEEAENEEAEKALVRPSPILGRGTARGRRVPVCAEIAS
jgi:hypothetical protein